MKFTVIKDLMKKYSENSAIQDGTSDIVTEQSAFDICKSIPIYDEDGSFTLIAARPGMGKTTFMLQSAVSVALHKQKPVYIISLEHSAESLLRILLKTVDEPFENNVFPIFFPFLLSPASYRSEQLKMLQEINDRW